MLLVSISRIVIVMIGLSRRCISLYTIQLKVMTLTLLVAILLLKIIMDLNQFLCIITTIKIYIYKMSYQIGGEQYGNL